MNNVNIKPYHHGDLRDEMVRIGVQLAAEGGPEAVKLREAARRAGVSASAAYRHFPGQEGLLEAVRQAAVEALGRSMGDAVTEAAAEGPTGRVIATGRGYFEFALNQPLLFRCLASGFELPEDDPGDGPFALLLELVGTLQNEAPSGLPDQTARFNAAVALWSAAHGISVLCTSGALRDAPQPRKRELLEVTLSTAVRGLRF